VNITIFDAQNQLLLSRILLETAFLWSTADFLPEDYNISCAKSVALAARILLWAVKLLF
jgi:hypothetical protein